MLFMGTESSAPPFESPIKLQYFLDLLKTRSKIFQSQVEVSRLIESIYTFRVN